MQSDQKRLLHNLPRYIQGFLPLVIGVLLLLQGCSSPSTQSGIKEDLKVNSATETFTSEVSTTTPAMTSTTVPATIAPEPLMLFLPGSIPNGILNIDLPITHKQSLSSNSTLWFGVLQSAPQGEVLHTSTWVYALAAPFPTLLDNITMDEFSQLWFGRSENPAISATKLYVSQAIAKTLESEWGYRDQSTVIAVDTIPDPDTLWDENAWAILPFDELDPKLKVISIGGESPLLKDFNSSTYPLSFQYLLVDNQSISPVYTASDVQTIIAAITPTNRDTEKMTTLIMTGVTALVRATAYKMEVNGVLYPGEEIVNWLSEADLTHISNEVSFYEDCPFPNPNSRMLLFCSDPKYIELIEFIGADIIELTGNHNNDSLYVYGIDVVPFTLDLYRQRGMSYFGGGLNLAEAQSPLLITHNGNQLAFIGCNAPGPDFAWATDEHGGAAPCGDYQWMVDEISRLRGEGVLPIATFQYYEDYYNFAGEHHIRDFGRMAEAGAVIVNGSQAHRPKGMAFEHGTFIDYGLGNLFFDQMGIIDDYGNQILQTRWEIIQRHTFYNGQHVSTELLTAMLYDYAQPRPMTDQERQVFLEELFSASNWNSR